MCISYHIKEVKQVTFVINPLNVELYPIFYLLALLGANHILHFSSIRVKRTYVSGSAAHILFKNFHYLKSSHKQSKYLSPNDKTGSNYAMGERRGFDLFHGPFLDLEWAF